MIVLLLGDLFPTKGLDTTADPVRLGVEMKPVVSDFQLDELAHSIEETFSIK